MMKFRVAVLTFAVLLGGCSFGGSPKATSSPTPKVKASAATSPSPSGVSDAVWSMNWGVWGMGTPPPRNLADLVKEPLPAKAQNLTNLNGGVQVSDADVAKWLAAFQRTSSIANYLFEHLDDRALQGGALADPSKSAYAHFGALKTIAAAKQAGATALAFTVPFKDQAVGVAFVPEALRTDASNQWLQLAPLTEYVMVVRYGGPGRTDQVFADRHKVPVIQSPASYQGTFLMAGTYKVDPVLGPLWYEQNEIDCKDYPKLQAVCASLAP